VENNAKVEIGKVYNVDYQTGMLMVAYPNHNATTDFEFSYWLDSFTTGGDESNCVGDDCTTMTDGGSSLINIFDGDANSLLYQVAAGALVIFLVVLLICLCKCSKNKNKIEIIDEDKGLESGQNFRTGSGSLNGGKNPNDTSVELDSIENEDNENPPKSKGKTTKKMDGKPNVEMTNENEDSMGAAAQEGGDYDEKVIDDKRYSKVKPNTDYVI